MNERSSPSRRRASLGTRVRVGLSLGLVLGLGATGTMALFSATSTADPGILTGGSLDVTVNGELAGATNRDGTLTVEAWQANDLLPGESVAIDITVANNGTGNIPFDVRLNAYTLGTLGPSLGFQIFNEATAVNSTSLAGPASESFRTGRCDGGAFVTATVVGQGAENAFEVDPFKHRLDIGESFNYCVIIAPTAGAPTIANTALLNAKGTASFIVRATQEGAP